MSRRLACAVITGAILLVVPAVAVAHGTSKTVTVWGKVVRYESIDQNGGGMGMGDLYAGTNALSAKRGGTSNGALEWVATVVRQNMPGGMEYRSVQWRFAWKGASLVATGLFEADQGVQPHSHLVQTRFVTGGAGAYFGARGTVTATTINKTDRKYVIHLVGIEPQP